MELWSKTIISVLDGSVMVKQSDMEIKKNETSYLCIGSGEITSSPSQKSLNFAQPLLLCLL